MTVKGIKPIAPQQTEYMSRPMNVLQEDKLEQLNNSTIDENSAQPILTSFDEKNLTDHLEDLRNHWKRLPGQVLFYST